MKYETLKRIKDLKILDNENKFKFNIITYENENNIYDIYLGKKAFKTIVIKDLNETEIKKEIEKIIKRNFIYNHLIEKNNYSIHYYKMTFFYY